MSKYQCELCDKQFMQKIDIERHKSKKNACVPVEKVNKIIQENEKLKKQQSEKQKHDVMKASLSNLFKCCLDLLRDQEHLTGDKALRTIAYLLILRLSEPQIKNGNIDIDELDYYDLSAWAQDDVERYMSYARFSILQELPELGLVIKIKNLREIILCKHPKFKDLFQADDPFRIKQDATFKKLIKKLMDFPFEDYEADIQGEAYEEVIKDIMVGKVLGQFFTPPLLKQFMVELVDPQIKEDGKVETIFDPAMGTGGFLITSLRHYIRKAKENNIKLDWDYISKQAVGGREAEPDTYQLCKANTLISSGHTFDTLECGDSIRNPIPKQYDIILTNPPFGIKGIKYDEITDIYDVKKEDYIPIASNSAIPLFLQAIIHMLKIGGRCATVVPNGQELFNKTSGLVSIREYLMKTCNLKKIIHIPAGIFNNTDIKTCVFYFEKMKERTDVLNVNIKGKKTCYKFVEEHCTVKVGFYDYDPFKNEKKLLVEVGIEDIKNNSYSLNYSEYIKQEENIHDNLGILKLKDICEVQTGEYITKSTTDKGTYPVYGGGDASYHISRFNREDTLVINKDGVSETCVRFTKGKFFLNHHGWTLKIINKDICEKYLHYYLMNIQNELYILAKGAAQKGINQIDFYNIKIPIPSLKTQEEIVEQLDFLYQAIETSEKKIEELKRINKIIMDNQKKYEKTTTNIGQIFKLEKGKIQSSKTISGDYPLISISSNKTHNEYSDDNEILVIAKISSGNSCGPFKTRIYYYNGKCAISNLMSKIIPLNENIILKYYYYYLNNIKEEIEIKCEKGVANKTLNEENFNKFKIPIPSIELQKEIVHKLDNNSNIIVCLKNEINNNKQLCKEILDNIIKNKNNAQIDHPLETLIETINLGKNIPNVSTTNTPPYTIPYYTPTEIKYCDTTSYSGKYILIARGQTNQGVAQLVDSDFSANSNMIIIKLKEEYADYYDTILKQLNDFDFKTLIEENPITITLNGKSQLSKNIGISHVKNVIVKIPEKQENKEVDILQNLDSNSDSNLELTPDIQPEKIKFPNTKQKVKMLKKQLKEETK